MPSNFMEWVIAVLMLIAVIAAIRWLVWKK